MSKYRIEKQVKTREVVDRVHIIDGVIRQVLEVYHLDSTPKLVWQAQSGYLFSSEGYALESSDNKILKASDQT